MAEIVDAHKAETTQSKSSSDSKEDTNIEEELFYSLQEIIFLNKLISSHQRNN